MTDEVLLGDEDQRWLVGLDWTPDLLEEFTTIQRDIRRDAHVTKQSERSSRLREILAEVVAKFPYEDCVFADSPPRDRQLKILEKFVDTEACDGGGGVPVFCGKILGVVER